jgi:hypothetical protein
MAMEKFGIIRRYAPDGRRMADFVDVGHDPQTDTLWNPRGYDPCELRRAISAFRAYLDDEHRKRAESPKRRRDHWNDSR